MLLIRGSGCGSGGLMSDALVSHFAVFPTLRDLTATQPPPWLQGQSLAPLVTARHEHPAPDLEINDAVFAEVTNHVAYEPPRAVRTPRWTYVRRFGDRSTPVVANCDESPSRAIWLAAGWAQRSQPTEALFDNVLDPMKGTNLAPEPAFAEGLADLRNRLAVWMAATDNPLLAGKVPLPPGAVANSPDALTPEEPLYSG